MISGIIAQMGNQGEGVQRERLKPDDDTLKELAVRYFNAHPFRPGDLVRWKEGLKNRALPDYGEPVVVLAVKPGNQGEGVSCTSMVYQEPLELRIGVYADDENFVGFWMDANRFEPYPEIIPEPTVECAAAETPLGTFSENMSPGDPRPPFAKS